MAESPKTVYGECVLHGRPVSTSDGICPECRALNEQTHGEYLAPHPLGAGVNPSVPTVFRQAWERK